MANVREWFIVVGTDEEAYFLYTSEDKANQRKGEWDVRYPRDAPHRVIKVREVEE